MYTNSMYRCVTTCVYVCLYMCIYIYIHQMWHTTCEIVYNAKDTKRMPDMLCCFCGYQIRVWFDHACFAMKEDKITAISTNVVILCFLHVYGQCPNFNQISITSQHILPNFEMLLLKVKVHVVQFRKALLKRRRHKVDTECCIAEESKGENWSFNRIHSERSMKCSVQYKSK